MSDNNGPPQNNGLTAAECVTAAALLVGIFWIVFVCLKWMLSTRAGRITLMWIVGIFFVLAIIGAIIGPPVDSNNKPGQVTMQSLDQRAMIRAQENSRVLDNFTNNRGGNCTVTPTTTTCTWVGPR